MDRTPWAITGNGMTQRGWHAWKRPQVRLEPLGCCREDKASVHGTHTLLTETKFYCTWIGKQYLFIMRVLQFIVKLMSLWKCYKIVYNLIWLSVVDYILILIQPLGYFSLTLNHNASYTLYSSGPWGNSYRKYTQDILYFEPRCPTYIHMQSSPGHTVLSLCSFTEENWDGWKTKSFTVGYL